MTDQTTTAKPVTIATAAYEASSLLNSRENLPQPHYITAHANTDGTVSVTFQMGTAADVIAWGALSATAQVTTTRMGIKPGGRPATSTTVTFPHPFDARISVEVYDVTYDD